MHPKKIENVFNLSAENRFDYFINKVVDFEELWSLKQDDGWATMQNNEGQILLPFWPEKEFAQSCAIDKWQNYYPEKIDLYDFMDKWIPGMIKDKRLVAVFPSLKNKGIVMEPAKVLEDLEEELKNFE